MILLLVLLNMQDMDATQPAGYIALNSRIGVGHATDLVLFMES